MKKSDEKNIDKIIQKKLSTPLNFREKTRLTKCKYNIKLDMDVSNFKLNPMRNSINEITKINPLFEFNQQLQNNISYSCQKSSKVSIRIKS